jgi:hypothetical protein
MKRPLLLTAGLLLSACGQQLSGTYSDEAGLTKYTFKSGDKVYVSVLGTETELTYTIDGDKVTLNGPQGNVVLTLSSDGSLQGPLGVALRKQSE